MSDNVRNAVMSRSSYMGSNRKNTAEEVAKRRAIIQQEIELRQKLARKLQDEKMARAIAQKEGHLLKQREVHQREMLRAKAVLNRHSQILAEKEKEKKEAVLVKVHALASRPTTQNKSRPVYAFGSSTPRELEYLTQLTRDQKVYDRKPIHSGRISTATSGLSSLTSSYDSRHYTDTTMTGSLHVAPLESKKSQKRTSNFMTQSMMIAQKPNKTTKIHQTSVQSMTQRPLIATKTLSSTVNEVPIRTKKLIQQNVSPLDGQEPRIVRSKSKAKIEGSEAEFMSREKSKSSELKPDNEIKAEVMLEKSPNDQKNETHTVLEKNDTEVQDDITVENENITHTEVVNSVPDVNGFRKSDGKCLVVEVPDAKERIETADYASKVVGIDMRVDDADMKNKITLENEPADVTGVTAIENLLLDISSEQEDNFVNETKTNTAATVNAVTDKDLEVCFRIREKQERENDVLKEAQLRELLCDNPVTVCPDSSQTEFAVENQRNVASRAEVVVRDDSLIVHESFPETGKDSRQEEVFIQKHYETGGDEKETAIGTNENFAREKTELSAQNNVTLNPVGIETIAEDLKLTEEKNSAEEKRRIQDELLAKEQREREMRKAKLASIMSRTRTGASSVSVISGVPSVSVVSSALLSENSETETQKHGIDIPLSNENLSTPVKNVLSHATASVLQKLATTNPKLLSVLQRNGSNRSLADELSATAPSISITIPGQPADSITSHEGSSTARHLHFEPDVNHRPVAMK